MHHSMHGFVTYAKGQNLSLHQFGALFHIHRSGGCAVSDISDDLGITTAAVSQMLERLVQSGLIARSEDPNDRRAKRIDLTEAGIGVAAYVDIDPRKAGRAVQGIPIVSFQSFERSSPADFSLAAVGVPGARKQIRDFLHTLGLVEPLDFVCVA